MSPLQSQSPDILAWRSCVCVWHKNIQHKWRPPSDARHSRAAEQPSWQQLCHFNRHLLLISKKLLLTTQTNAKCTGRGAAGMPSPGGLRYKPFDACLRTTSAHRTAPIAHRPPGQALLALNQTQDSRVAQSAAQLTLTLSASGCAGEIVWVCFHTQQCRIRRVCSKL